MTYLEYITQAAIDDDQGPASAQEIAQHQIAMALAGTYQATSELVRLRCDPIAGQILNSHEGDLWACKSRIDTLISEIRAANGERPLPAEPKLRLVR